MVIPTISPTDYLLYCLNISSTQQQNDAYSFKRNKVNLRYGKKSFLIENASFRPLYCAYSLYFIAAEECLATKSFLRIFQRCKTPTNAHRLVTERHCSYIAITGIRCLNSVASLESFLLVPFHLFPTQGSYLSEVRRSLKGFFLARVFFATAFGLREFRNHFKYQPAFFSSFSFFLLLNT